MLRLPRLREPQLTASAPEFCGLEDPERREDARDELGGGDIEAGVAGVAAWICDADVGVLSLGGSTPGSEDLLLGTFFNRDVGSGLEGPVQGGQRDGDVERDLMAPRQHGLGIGADLVGDVPGATENAVRSDDDEIDLAALHEMAGRVVGDDMVGDALLAEFPRSEGGSLGTWAGFVAVDVEFPSGGLGGVERRRGGADIDEGQPAGIAVGENVHAFADEGKAVFTNLPAMTDILLGEGFGGLQR